MRHFYLLALFSFLSLNIYAQDFEYAKITGDDLDLKSSRLDSNANAMVIKEFGTAAMRHNDVDGRMYIDFQYHVRIKVFNKNGFGSGNVVIPLRVFSDDLDQVKELKATTLNFVNGTLVQTQLDKSKIFTEKKNKYWVLTKFTMPNLREGSIIEYSYRINSPYIFNFRTWEFQSDIPKIYSEYVAYIPALYNYNVVLRGGRKLNSQDAVLNKACIRVAAQDIDCSKITYIMKDIPALVEEDYMTSPDNFRASIHFELSDYYLLNGGGKRNVTKTWKDVDNELLNEKEFGGQLKKKDIFKAIMPEVLKNTTDNISKAKAVYAYIKKNIKADNFIGIYTENGVKGALDKHSGNTADINIALIAALGAAGLDAEAVILSLREHGTVNNLFPVISDFNYVIAKVNIGDQSYLLDATDPLLPFGLVPFNCINGQGRVINLKKPSYWVDIAASQKQSVRYNLEAELTPEGKIKGTLTTISMGYSALKKRKRITAASSVDEFVEKLDEQMPAISILKHHIQNLDSLDNPLVEKYEIEMKAFDMKNNRLYFNPFFINPTTKNPFNLNERTYPVDLGAATEERVSIVLKLPAGYSIADQPKNAAMALESAGGKYLTATSIEDNVLVFNEVFQLNKPIYLPEEYLSLKEFYSRIIQLQKTDLVLKK